MSEMKYKQGDILVKEESGDTLYRRVLGVYGECYAVSPLVYNSIHSESDTIKFYDKTMTQHELDTRNWELYTPPKEVEMTVAEISEALGKTVKVVE